MTTAPQGYKSRNTDVVGYWAFGEVPGENGIHCIPRFAKAFDSNLDKNKPSILIVCELLDECKLKNAEDDDDDEEFLNGLAGDMVGVWYKPGMKPILTAAGLKTFIVFAGEKDIGKASPMKRFDVSCESNRSFPLELVEDTRDKSRHVETFFDKKSARRQQQPNLPATTTAASSDEDIPF